VRLAVVTAVVVGGVLAVGVPAALTRASTPAQPAVSLATWNGGDQPATGAAVRARAREVYESFAGTAEQRDALTAMRAGHRDPAMGECMAAAGHPEWAKALRPPRADPDDPLKTSMWLAMPMSRWRSHDLVAAKPFLESEKVMNADHGQAYSDAISVCEVQTRSSSNSTASGQRVLPTHRVHRAHLHLGRLRSAWWDDIAKFDRSRLPDQQAYVECMNDATVPIMKGEKPEFAEFGTQVGYAMSGASPADSAIPSDPSDDRQWANPAWQKFLTLETGFDNADWSCRKAVYTKFIGDLSTLIDAFGKQHATEIAQGKQFWRDANQQAARLR
jgi:hypothetical protein